MWISVAELPQQIITILHCRNVREFLFPYQTMKYTIHLFEIYYSKQNWYSIIILIWTFFSLNGTVIFIQLPRATMFHFLTCLFKSFAIFLKSLINGPNNSGNYLIKMLSTCVIWLKRSLSTFNLYFDYRSVQFSPSVVSDSLRPHELQHARPPCPSPTPRVHSDSRTQSHWCHPAISSSVVPFSSCPQSSQQQSLFQS